MCGIAGVLHFDGRPVAETAIRRMTDAIAHRGPDGEGCWIEGGVGFGHRRLAIIDLSSAGHQPMVSDDGRFVITYNGEVYNFMDLRSELKSKGYQFHSRTDSEVVLNAYIEWGEDCLSRFNGMFSFAIWDRAGRELFMARDRYGIKPLYYYRNGNSFLFGSEVKALLAYPSFQVEMDKEALLEYFTFQNFFTDKTLYAGVRMLPAGHFLRVSDNGGEPRTTQYWDYSFSEPDAPADEQEYIEELDRLLQQAVRRQLVSDVDVGAYLSGGMDSGTITALAAKQLPYMHTFTVGFDLSSASGLEAGFDERSKAEQMSYLFRTEHYEMVLKAGDMERVMPELVWHLDEPRVGQSYPNYYAAKLASKFSKVVLTGTGGDELFGGYPWRYYRAVVNDDFEHYIDKYYQYWQRLIPNNKLKQVFAPIWGDVDRVWTRDIMKNVFLHGAHDMVTPEDYINHSLYLEAKTFLHGLFVVEDKLSMAHGLENRVPFMDNDLVDFAMKLPVGLKLGNLNEVVSLNENEPGSKTSRYFQKTRDGKLLLRKVMERHIPKVVTEREKQGFSAPDASWFKGDSIEYVKDSLMRGDACLYEFLDRDAIHSLVREHLDGKCNRRLLIWSLLNVEKWCQQNLHGSVRNQ